MLTIDGSRGEGGGQVLRSSLTLSLVTGTPFGMEHIRARRARPGLLRQHVAAVDAAAAISDADVTGALIGSREVSFRPGPVRAGTYTFTVGTAGSAGLVLQTVLLPLVLAGASSSLTLEGGTHNPAAPPFDFLARVFLPLVRRMGAPVEAHLERHGFYPAGGGRIRVSVGRAAGTLAPLGLLDRGTTRRRLARAIVSGLPRTIAEREVAVVADQLGWTPDELAIDVLPTAPGEPRRPGNVLLLEVESEHVTECFTGFGTPGVRAETVAGRAVDDARRYLASNVPVGPYLADQLLLPLAIAGGGMFRTLPLTPHSTTNMDVIRDFLAVQFSVTAERSDAVRVELGSPVLSG